MAININALQQQMNAIAMKNRQQQAGTYLAGQADKAMGYMFAPGKVQLSKSANPFQ